MARRKGGEENIVSLFPFLSILACVIGVLTLIITGMVLGQMDSQGNAEIEMALQYLDLQKQVKQDHKELERYHDLHAEARAIRQLLAAAQAELKRLQKEKQQVDDKREREQALNVRLLAEADSLRKRSAELAPELKAHQESVQKLKAELAKRKDASESRIAVRPSGSGTGLIPHFVECTATDVVLHERPKPVRVRRADLGGKGPFRDLLERVKKQKGGTLIFLVRADGSATYYAARDVARDEYVNNGKLPVPGHGRIDLSLFRNIR